MPSLSYAQLEAYRADREALKEMREMEAIRLFVPDLLDGVGIVLATTPYEQWPTMAKEAFKAAKRRAPVGAQMYLSRLPKPEPKEDK